jgi:hypothetical protein
VTVELDTELLHTLIVGRDYFLGLFKSETDGGGWASDETRDAVRAVWNCYSRRITEAHARRFPGTRPAAFWWFDAPKPRREQVSGHEYAAGAEPDYRKKLWFGVPCCFGFSEHEDPPVFESTAEYLARHKLLLPFERAMYEAGELAKTDSEENDGCRALRIVENPLDYWGKTPGGDIESLLAELTGTVARRWRPTTTQQHDLEN